MGNQLDCRNGSVNWTVDQTALIRSKEQDYSHFKDRFLVTYEILMYVIAGLGLLGNACCLFLLIRGKSFRTAHFIFYRFLAGAELLYCCNFFAEKIIVGATFVEPRTFIFHFVAVWISSMSKFIYSTAGYVVMYMTIFISADRLSALWFPGTYHSWQTSRKHSKRCFIFCWIAVVLSALLHSWAAFVGTTVRPISRGNATLYRIDSDRRFAGVLKVKDTFTIIVRLSYPLVLLALTVVIIIGYVQYRSKKGTLLVSTNRSESRRPAAESRKEGSLFLLLIAVLIMTLVQVLPTELHRILILVHPMSNLQKCLGLYIKKGLAFETALRWSDLYPAVRVLAHIKNLGTLAERSFKFYLYVLLNSQFRKEFCNFFSSRILGKHIRNFSSRKSEVPNGTLLTYDTNL